MENCHKFVIFISTLHHRTFYFYFQPLSSNSFVSDFSDFFNNIQKLEAWEKIKEGVYVKIKETHLLAFTGYNAFIHLLNRVISFRYSSS